MLSRLANPVAMLFCNLRKQLAKAAVAKLAGRRIVERRPAAAVGREAPPLSHDAVGRGLDDARAKDAHAERQAKRADGTPWEPITGTLVPIVGGKEGLKQEWCGAAASASCQGRFATARPRAGR